MTLFVVSDCKVTTFFRISKLFFTFFHFWRLDLPTITNFVFMPVVLCSSLFRWSCVLVVCWSCVWWSPDNHIHAYIHARIYVRARGFLDSNF